MCDPLQGGPHRVWLCAEFDLFLTAKKTEYMDDNHQPICSKDGNPINSRRSLILRSSAPLLQTARRTSYYVRDKHGMPVTSCIISGNLASQSPLNWLTSGLVWTVSFLWCRTWTMKKLRGTKLGRCYLHRTSSYESTEHLLVESSNWGTDLWDILPISIIVAQRRARFADHCFRAKDQVFSNFVCWRLPCPNRKKAY